MYQYHMVRFAISSCAGVRFALYRFTALSVVCVTEVVYVLHRYRYIFQKDVSLTIGCDVSHNGGE